MRRTHSVIAVLSLICAACTTGDREVDTGARPDEAVVAVGTPAATVSATGEVANVADARAAVAGGANAAATTPATPAAEPAGTRKPMPTPAIVRGLYVNRFAAHSARKMARLVAVADTTEINALVIDMKDEFGLNYQTGNPEFAKNAGASTKVRNVRALLDTLRAHNVYAIARIVVFKDSVTARVHPEWTIRRPDSSVWRDHKGLAWVDPHNRALWDYNIGIAEELVRLGFDEIQFDYIRFPEPYKSLPPQVFPASKGQSKPDAIAEFLKVANARLDKLGVPSTADIFGLVTTVNGPLEVAQHWERLSPVTDVLLPMVYPSHYPPGSFGVARPNAEPYKIVFAAIDRARQRDEKLGIRTPEHVRPWLQAFTLGKPPYTAEHIEAQKRAVYDAGYDGWVLWHPGSKYEIFLPALEKSETTRKRASATAAR